MEEGTRNKLLAGGAIGALAYAVSSPWQARMSSAL